jgi:Transposase, Mutator family
MQIRWKTADGRRPTRGLDRCPAATAAGREGRIGAVVVGVGVVHQTAQLVQAVHPDRVVHRPGVHPRRPVRYRHHSSHTTDFLEAGQGCYQRCADVTAGPVDAVWPQAITQTCLIHLLRNSFRYASKRDWAAIAKDLKLVYTAASESAALDAFVAFSETWGERYPAIIKLWENAWAEFVLSWPLTRKSAA